MIPLRQNVVPRRKPNFGQPNPNAQRRTPMEIRLHVKTCEGCGCLWYRANTNPGVYCSRCAVKLRDFPAQGSRKLRGRPRRKLVAQ